MLMTVSDSRGGRNKTSTLTYRKERFSATAAQLKWSRIKLICRQPYNTTAQFGLQHVAFYTEHSTLCSPITPQVSPHHKHPTPAHSESTPHRTNSRHRLPPLPSVGPCKQGDPNLKTPHTKSKRPLREANEEGGSEMFSGVEKQSRLLKNALRTPQGESHSNPILDRIASEREKMKESSFETFYQKKRLLVKELCKAEGKTDFAAGFDKTSGKSVEMSAAFRKISRHDDGCEIGQEPEHGQWGSRNRGRRGRGKKIRGGQGGSEDAWVSKRRKKLSGMISECRRVLSEAGTAGGTSGPAEDLTSTAVTDDSLPIKPDQSTAATDSVCVSDSDSDATIIMEDEESLSTSPPPPLPHSVASAAAVPEVPAPSKASVQCPLCGQQFPSYAIELHAANCSNSRNTLLPIYID